MKSITIFDVLDKKGENTLKAKLSFLGGYSCDQFAFVQHRLILLRQFWTKLLIWVSKPIFTIT